MIGSVAVTLKRTAPSEATLVQLRRDFFHARVGLFLGEIADPDADEIEEDGALIVGERAQVQATWIWADAVLAGRKNIVAKNEGADKGDKKGAKPAAPAAAAAPAPAAAPAAAETAVAEKDAEPAVE